MLILFSNVAMNHKAYKLISMIAEKRNFQPSKLYTKYFLHTVFKIVNQNHVTGMEVIDKSNSAILYMKYSHLM